MTQYYRYKIVCINRTKFPSVEGEPDLLQTTKDKNNKISSWSKMKSVIRM